MRIVFMGTPEFACTSLEALISHGCEVAGVVTAPDKGAGRGRNIQEPAVKKCAEKYGLPVLQPHNLKDAGFLADLKALKADLQVVVAFRMLPEAVWAMPPKGTVNLHASLLPDYRGAAPINWAIINGDTETGITTFFIEQQIDTGKIIFQEKVLIPETWTAGQLHDEMKVRGAALLVRTVEAVAAGAYQALDQLQVPGARAVPRPAPKIYKEDCRVDWRQSASTIYNFIRGLSPYPAAWSELQAPNGIGTSIKIFQCSIASDIQGGNPGSITTNGKDLWRVACGEGFVDLEIVQQAGKKKMPVGEFLRGASVNNEWKLIN